MDIKKSGNNNCVTEGGGCGAVEDEGTVEERMQKMRDDIGYHPYGHKAYVLKRNADEYIPVGKAKEMECCDQSSSSSGTSIRKKFLRYRG